MKKIIINESQFNLLIERLTSVLFHFTSIEALYNILKDDRFVLATDVEDMKFFHPHDHFFLSLTRQRDGRQGWSNVQDVRIYLDGDKLNQRFSGKSVDFFKPKTRNDRPYIQDTTENEDRLFAKQGIIKDAKSYITRIDICAPDVRTYPMIYHILQMFDNVYVYDNYKSFNCYGNDIINQKIINEYEGCDSPTSRISSLMGKDKVKAISYILCYISRTLSLSQISKLLRRFGLEEFESDVLQSYEEDAKLFVTKRNRDWAASDQLARLRVEDQELYDKVSRMMAYGIEYIRRG